MTLQEYKNIVAEMGCVVCYRPAELHHPRTFAGCGTRAHDLFVIPLCPEHHRTGGVGVAIHCGKKTFESIYGTEIDLMIETMLKVLKRCSTN